MKRCVKCQEWKAEDAFMYRYDRGQKRAREAACRECRKGHDITFRRNRTKEYRQGERARAKPTYLPYDVKYPWWKKLGTGYGEAVNLRAHGWRSRAGTQGDVWIERLRTELPDLYDTGLAPTTLEFRARYHLDADFKAAQIRRTHKRRSEECNSILLDDGTLTGPAIRTLFAHAKDCLYCGKPMRSQDKTLDHVWPRSKGGWHSITNAVVCCSTCNTKKRAKSPEHWLSCLSGDRQAKVRKSWKLAGIHTQQPYLVA